MVSFKEEIEKNKALSAYCMGGDARLRGEEPVPPFDKDSRPGLDWLDGYYDQDYIMKLGEFGFD